MNGPQFLRLKDQARRQVEFHVDGRPRQALLGDTIMTALLTQGTILRDGEFGGPGRAGFCLMGACQDCWVWLEDGRRLRACTTFVEPAMRILTSWPSKLLES